MVLGLFAAALWAGSQFGALSGQDNSGDASSSTQAKKPEERGTFQGPVRQTSDWHEFGMEWKEHIAWMAPMLATLAAFLVFYYGPVLARNRTARLLVLVIFVGAFTTAAIAGLFGALITKTAPIT
jgi:hypothetical protein